MKLKLRHLAFISCLILLASVLVMSLALSTHQTNAQSDPTPIAYGQVIIESITDDANVFTYTFSGVAGDQVSIIIQPPSFTNTDLRLTDPNGEVIAVGGSFAAFERAIFTTLPADGNYLITVERLAGDSGTGDFSIWLDKPVVLSPNAPVSGDTLQRPGVSNFFLASSALIFFTPTEDAIHNVGYSFTSEATTSFLEMIDISAGGPIWRTETGFGAFAGVPISGNVQLPLVANHLYLFRIGTNWVEETFQGVTFTLQVNPPAPPVTPTALAPDATVTGTATSTGTVTGTPPTPDGNLTPTSTMTGTLATPTPTSTSTAPVNPVPSSTLVLTAQPPN